MTNRTAEPIVRQINVLYMVGCGETLTVVVAWVFHFETGCCAALENPNYLRFSGFGSVFRFDPHF